MNKAATLVLWPRPDLARVKGLLAAFDQQPAVGKAGELVVKGQLGQSLLGGPPGGDVLDLGKQDTARRHARA